MPTIFTRGAASASGFGFGAPAVLQGGLWSWGYNTSFGQLGLGNLTNYSSPKAVGALVTWAAVSAGFRHTLVVKTDGTLWAWGNGTGGQLGLSVLVDYSSPKQVGALTAWSKVSAGPGSTLFSLAIKTNGTLWAWGINNPTGALGTSNITDYNSPVQVGALTIWATVSTGNTFSTAVRTDGRLFTWGYNQNGELGLGNLTKYSSPKQVGALTNWSTVSAGNFHTLAVKTDGTLWAWGANNSGQLGLGNTTNYSSPKQVGALTTWSKVEGGARCSAAIKTDGTLWTWGQGTTGVLGLGNNTYYSSPMQVGALTTWNSISANGTTNNLGGTMAAVKVDGTLWTWGRNDKGQAGLGTSGPGTYQSSPVQVGALTTWLAASSGGMFMQAIKT